MIKRNIDKIIIIAIPIAKGIQKWAKMIAKIEIINENVPKIIAKIRIRLLLFIFIKGNLLI